MNDFGDLGDFFSLVGDEKKKNDEKNKELMGEVSLGDLFTSLSEEKKKVVKKRKKKEEELEKLKKEAKIFENLFFDTPQKEINTKDWKDDYTPIEIETEDVITPEPLKPSEPVVEYEELEESVDNKTTIDKSLEILDQIVVEEDKINESETEIARLKREMDQLRKMINETARVASAQGGGGEVRFQYLDDIVGIASNLSSFDGMYLGIDASNSAQPFKFSSVSSNTGAGGTWATFDSNTGVTTTKKVKINNDLEVTGVTTSTGGFVGSLTGSASSLSGVSSSFLLDYDNFTNTPTIPTNNNQLSNGAGYITTSFTNTNQLTNGAGFVTFTNNNQLTNGAGYITTSFTNTNQLTNGAGFITNVVSGVLTATSFIGNGSGITGIVTNLVAGDNISLNNSTGTVTITGLAKTDRINAESLVVSGVATFSSNVTIGGTLTYEDVTNIDSIGLITARNGINVSSGGIDVTGHTETDTLNVSGVSTFQSHIHLGDADEARFGDSNDLKIYHSTNSVIANTTGNLILASNGLKLKSGNSSKSYYEHSANGEVKIFYDNSKKFETTAGGIDVTGIVSATSYNGSGSNLSGIVTNIIAGDNINVSGSTGQVTITGLANTANVVADSLQVTGITTLGVVTSVTSIQATTYYGDGSKLTGISAGAGGTENVSSNTTISGIITASEQFYPPTLTTSERDALTVTQGALIFNTTENKVQMYLGSEWKSLAFELDTYTSIGI